MTHTANKLRNIFSNKRPRRLQMSADAVVPCIILIMYFYITRGNKKYKSI